MPCAKGKGKVLNEERVEGANVGCVYWSKLEVLIGRNLRRTRKIWLGSYSSKYFTHDLIV